MALTLPHTTQRLKPLTIVSGNGSNGAAAAPPRDLVNWTGLKNRRAAMSDLLERMAASREAKAEQLESLISGGRNPERFDTS
ncbi:hypothetical protein AA0311_0283 [Asaia bogorensis NBRC 16594]|uniref:Uncharacterized protein n=1 Tax=Asaia bogorensis NBRC 16594 TaxID=1231624 RepID=A0AAN4R1K8_9PROT|nr:hypothetical protein AA0311_0283 [Asaia bogorensis NBRC 16594]GEL53313.1 hypothetical protein ABO01nite_13200 [Asaia bogorensis NBRC 16594]